MYSSGRDLTRRREDIRRLQNERTRLKTLEKTSVASSDRDSLLRSSGGGLGGRAAAEEAVATRDLTTQQLMERTEAEMKNQDAIIDEMSNGLTGLQGITVAIGDEASLHLVRALERGCIRDYNHVTFFLSPPQKLLDNLEQEVDKGTVNLQAETDRAKKVTKASASCWLYVVICLLLLVLIALIMVRWVG